MDPSRALPRCSARPASLRTPIAQPRTCPGYPPSPWIDERNRTRGTASSNVEWQDRLTAHAPADLLYCIHLAKPWAWTWKVEITRLPYINTCAGHALVSHRLMSVSILRQSRTKVLATCNLLTGRRIFQSTPHNCSQIIYLNLHGDHSSAPPFLPVASSWAIRAVGVLLATPLDPSPSSTGFQY